jgi:hypothetical protein
MKNDGLPIVVQVPETRGSIALQNEPARPISFLQEDIEKIRGAHERVPEELQQLSKPYEKPLILAIDTESDSQTRHLLSIQICKDGCKPEIYFAGPLVRKISLKQLWGYLQRYCKKNKIPLPKSDDKTIFLLSHFNWAELRHITEFTKKPATQKAAKKRTKPYFDVEMVGDLFHATTDIASYKLRFVDTNAFFHESLEKASANLTPRKIKLAGYAGKTEKYWKTHMAKLLAQHRRKFKDYALRDVVVLAKLWSKWRDFFITTNSWNLDLLQCRSLSQAAAKLFRKYYLKTSLVPYVASSTMVPRGRKYGQRSYTARQKRSVLDPRLRTFSLRCYHGGRGEGISHGYYKNRVKLMDVKSMYPSVTLTQPLPTAQTQWTHYLNPAFSNAPLVVEYGAPTTRPPDLKPSELAEVEGFVHTQFKYPDNCMYPALPVETAIGVYSPERKTEAEKVLIWPLIGESYCTIEELRTAQRLEPKLHVTIIEAWFFYPKKPETLGHPIRAFIEMTLTKRKTAKTPLEKKIWKDIGNSFLGKLIERIGDDDINELATASFSGTLDAYDESRKPKMAGALWMPECDSLLLGAARAVISRYMALGSLQTLTDSCVFPEKVRVPKRYVPRLRDANSEIERQKDHDPGYGLLNIRKACFAFLRRNLAPVGRVRKGNMSLDDDLIANIIQGNLKAGASLTQVAPSHHLVSLKEYYRDRKLPFGFESNKQVKLNWMYDMKRCPDRWPINVWCDYVLTRPWKSENHFLVARRILALLKRAHLTEKEAGNFFLGLRALQTHPQIDVAKAWSIVEKRQPRGRRPTYSQKKIQGIRRAKGNVRDIAKRFGVSSQTVSRIKHAATKPPPPPEHSLDPCIVSVT